MNKAAIIAAPLAVVVLFPMLILVAVAGVGGITQAACNTATAATGTQPAAGAPNVVDLPALPGGPPPGARGGAFRLASFNVLGASHTGGGAQHRGWPTGVKRIAGAIELLNRAGISIAGLQEFENSQKRAFRGDVRGSWSMYYPGNDPRNAIVWRTDTWRRVSAGSYRIPYIRNQVAMPIVLLQNRSTDARVYVVNTHNPSTLYLSHAAAAAHQTAALKTQLGVLQRLTATGVPTVMTGDFNDRNQPSAVLGRLMHEAPRVGNDADHIFGSNLTFSGTYAIKSTTAQKISDHALLIANVNLAPGRTGSPTPTGPPTNAGTPPKAAGKPGSASPYAVQQATAAPSSDCGPCPNSGAGATAAANIGPGALHDTEVAAAAAYQAGFRGNDLYTMVWIAGGESSYNPHATNHYSASGHTYHVYGLWQISDIHAGVSPPGIYDPLANANQAFALYRGRGGSRLGDGGPASRFDDWSAHVPGNEAKYGPIARKAIAAVAGDTNPTLAGGVIAATAATCSAGTPADASPVGMHGRGNFTPNTSVPYVGPYTPGQLIARMQKIMALNGTHGNLDPFFGTEPDSSWYRDCQHFVANLDGRTSSGYRSAAIAWSHFLATGAAHPAGSADGMSPPAGAWLYYGNNHVVVYLGNNLIAGTDTWGRGSAKIGPASDVQKWLARQGGYKGWVAPWAGR